MLLRLYFSLCNFPLPQEPHKSYPVLIPKGFFCVWPPREIKKILLSPSQGTLHFPCETQSVSRILEKAQLKVQVKFEHF